LASQQLTTSYKPENKKQHTYNLNSASAHTYSAQALDSYRHFKFSSITTRITLKF